MVTTENLTPTSVVERNINLIGKLMNHFLSKPQIVAALPDDFELLILPDDDVEMRQYNFELLDKYAEENKPVVFVRMKSSKVVDVDDMHPNLYVPVAMAA